MQKEKKDVKRKDVCEKCGGTGFIISEKGIVPCECRAEYLLKQRLAAAAIPPHYRNKSIDTFKGNDKKRRQLRNDVKAYVSSFKPQTKGETKKGLLFIGCTGSGKTHLAVGILKAIIEKGYTGYYGNVVDFLAALRNTFSGDSTVKEMDIFDKFMAVDFLVLDDIGAEKPSDWMRDRLYMLVNRRYESNLPILVTTNKDIVELEEHVGKRTVSRLCEMCQIIEDFPDDDYRMKGLNLPTKTVRKKR